MGPFLCFYNFNSRPPKAKAQVTRQTEHQTTWASKRFCLSAPLKCEFFKMCSICFVCASSILLVKSSFAKMFAWNRWIGVRPKKRSSSSSDEDEAMPTRKRNATKNTRPMTKEKKKTTWVRAYLLKSSISWKFFSKPFQKIVRAYIFLDSSPSSQSYSCHMSLPVIVNAWGVASLSWSFPGIVFLHLFATLTVPIAKNLSCWPVEWSRHAKGIDGGHPQNGLTWYPSLLSKNNLPKISTTVGLPTIPKRYPAGFDPTAIQKKKDAAGMLNNLSQIGEWQGISRGAKEDSRLLDVPSNLTKRSCWSENRQNRI